MTWIDYMVLAIIGVSVIVSIMRGAVREVLALASWIVAFIAARFFSLDVAPMLSKSVSDEALRLPLAFLCVFVMTLLAMSLLSIAVSRLIKMAGLGVFDRILGAGFGLIRGGAIVTIGVLFAGLTTLPREPAWRNSISGERLAEIGNAAKAWLPYDLAKHIHYD